MHIQEKTNNYIAREIKNVLNNTDYVDEYSNIVINKISNISNNQTVRSLLSLVSNEEKLNNLFTVLRQSNINTNNIKNLVDVINYSKNSNLELSKGSSSTVENIKNLISLSKNIIDVNNTDIPYRFLHFNTPLGWSFSCHSWFFLISLEFFKRRCSVCSS